MASTLDRMTELLEPGEVPERILFGIGAQKAGTTWLADQIAASPDVYMPIKERHYWDVIRAPYIQWDRPKRVEPEGIVDRELASLHVLRARLKHGRLGERRETARRARFRGPYGDHRTYLATLAIGNPGRKVVGEVTPAYALCGRRTFAEMAELAPDVRFVFVMRDPVDRLWSGLRHRHRSRIESGEWGERDLLAAFDALIDDPYDPDFRRSDYARTLEELEAAVPGARILCLFYETLFEEKAMHRLADFLGIAPLRAALGQRSHAGPALGGGPSPALVRRAREALSRTYEAVASRFGDEVPAAWSAAGDMMMAKEAS